MDVCSRWIVDAVRLWQQRLEVTTGWVE